MRILLTGGAGYVGGRLAEWLSTTRAHEVVIGTRGPVDAAGSGSRGLRVGLDWSSDAGLAEICGGMDAIVHLAGMPAAECARDPAAALQVYGVNTARLVRAAASQQVRRFVYLSSAHVYGTALTGDVDESVAPEPRHPYAIGHRAAEDVVRSAHASGSLQGVVVRLSNTFGAPLDAEAKCWSLLGNDLCRRAVYDRRMVVLTAGTQRRDFLPMSEACRAIAHLLEAPLRETADTVFNVGSGTALTILELAQIVSDRVHALLGFRPELQVGQTIDVVGGTFRSFGIQRLTETGFVAKPGAMVEEFDRLVDFCLRNRGIAG